MARAICARLRLSRQTEQVVWLIALPFGLPDMKENKRLRFVRPGFDG